MVYTHDLYSTIMAALAVHWVHTYGLRVLLRVLTKRARRHPSGPLEFLNHFRIHMWWHSPCIGSNPMGSGCCSGSLPKGRASTHAFWSLKWATRIPKALFRIHMWRHSPCIGSNPMGSGCCSGYLPNGRASTHAFWNPKCAI